MLMLILAREILKVNLEIGKKYIKYKYVYMNYFFK